MLRNFQPAALMRQCRTINERHVCANNENGKVERNETTCRCYDQRVLYLHQINRCCVRRSWRAHAAQSPTGRSILFSKESKINENMSSPNMGSGVKRWESTLQGKREKFRPTHSLCDELSHTRDVLGREKGISRSHCCWYCALSRADNMEFGSGGDENAPHASIHPPLRCFIPSQKVSTLSIPKEMCSRKNTQGAEYGKRESGDKSAHGQWERAQSREQGKVLFGQIEQHQRLYPFHITQQ